MAEGGVGLVFESAELALDGELVALGARLHPADYLGVDIEGFGDVDDFLRFVWRDVDLEPVAHVEDLVHLLPIGAALLLDGLEQWRDGEEVVFDDVDVLDEVHDFGLGTSRAVHHAVDGGPHLVEHLLDDGGVGARGAKDEFAGVDGASRDAVGEAEASGVDQVVGDGGVVGLGVFLRDVFGEDVVAGAGESVASHSAVVFSLVGRLAEGGEAYDDVARPDVGVVDDVGSAHTARDGAIDDDCADEVADVGRLAARGVDAHTHLSELCEELVGAVDDGADYFAGDEHLVAPDGAGDEDVVDGPDAK